MIIIGNTDSNKDTSKVQQFPFSSHDLYVGKYLEKAVDQFIDSNYYENKISDDQKYQDDEINYLAFFGTTEEIKQLLVKECKLLNHLN